MTALQKYDGYIGSLHTKFERPQFQALYQLVGHRASLKMCDDLIHWIRGRPPAEILEKWMLEVDRGAAKIPPKAEEVMNRKVNAYMEHIHFDWWTEQVVTSRKLSEDIRNGDTVNAALYNAVANAVNYGRAVARPPQKVDQSAVKIGNVTIRTSGPNGSRRPHQKAIPAEFREVKALTG